MSLSSCRIHTFDFSLQICLNSNKMIKIQINLLAFFFHQNFDLNFCGNYYRATDLEKTDFFFKWRNVITWGAWGCPVGPPVETLQGTSNCRRKWCQALAGPVCVRGWPAIQMNKLWFGFWLELSQLHFKQANYSFNMQIQEVTHLPCFIMKAILDCNILVSSYWWCFRWFLSVF